MPLLKVRSENTSFSNTPERCSSTEDIKCIKHVQKAKDKLDSFSVNNPSMPTSLSLVASMASMGLVTRPSELSADELEALELFKEYASASWAGDFAKIEDFHRYTALCREAGDDDGVIPEHASVASANVDQPPVAGTSEPVSTPAAATDVERQVTADADQQPAHMSTESISNKDLKFPMPWTFPPAGKGMFIRSQTIHIVKILVHFKLFVKNSPNGAYELFELCESELQQASFGFPFSDYRPGRNFGALEARLWSPIYNKKFNIRITSRGIVTINNITHRDEITFAVRQVIDSFRAVGEAMLKSTSPADCGPLTPAAKKRAERFTTTAPRDVDIRNINAQTYLPGCVNTVKMQQACSAQLEPAIHDQSALCELKRSLLPTWYGKNVCVRVRSTGLISFAGLRNFEALNLCARKAYDLARDFICEPSFNICKSVNQRLRLAPLVRAIDAATSDLPVADATDDVEFADDHDDAAANDAEEDDGWSPQPQPPRMLTRRNIVARRPSQAYLDNVNCNSQNVGFNGVSATAYESQHKFVSGLSTPVPSMPLPQLRSTTERTRSQLFESPPVVSSSQPVHRNNSMLAKPVGLSGTVQRPNSSSQPTPTGGSRPHVAPSSQKPQKQAAPPRKSNAATIKPKKAQNKKVTRCDSSSSSDDDLRQLQKSPDDYTSSEDDYTSDTDSSDGSDASLPGGFDDGEYKKSTGNTGKENCNKAKCEWNVVRTHGDKLILRKTNV